MSHEPEYDPLEDEFTKYLQTVGYLPSVEISPVESGELLFTDGDAFDHVDDFMTNCRGHLAEDTDAYREEYEHVVQVAMDIGQVTKDPDHPSNPDNYERYNDEPDDCPDQPDDLDEDAEIQRHLHWQQVGAMSKVLRSRVGIIDAQFALLQQHLACGQQASVLLTTTQLQQQLAAWNEDFKSFVEEVTK